MVYLKNLNHIIFPSEIIRLIRNIIKSVLQFKKIKNFLNIQLFKLFGITNPFPYSIIIEPTSVCNLKCPMCPRMQNKTDISQGFMNLKYFKGIIDEIKDHIFLVSLYHNGESLLHNKIIDMIKYTNNNNLLTHLSTNLSFKNNKKIKELAHSGLDFLSVSLDGAKKETYKKYRKGGDFDQVIKNIKLLIKERKKTPLIEIQFLVMKGNEYEIDDIKKLAQNLKVDRLTLKSVITYNKEYDKKFQPVDKTYRLQLSKNIKCLYLFSRPVIAWNGLMFPCCSPNINFNKKYSLGNVFEKGFKNIWSIKKYQTFRKLVLKRSDKIKICQHCIPNSMNKNRIVFKLT